MKRKTKETPITYTATTRTFRSNTLYQFKEPQNNGFNLSFVLPSQTARPAAIPSLIAGLWMYGNVGIQPIARIRSRSISIVC